MFQPIPAFSSIFQPFPIRAAWTNINTSQGLFLDVMGAFETVWHKGLIATLNQQQVTRKRLDLFKSFLDNRKHVVVVDGGKYKILHVTARIPQGSKLGPLLLII